MSVMEPSVIRRKAKAVPILRLHDGADGAGETRAGALVTASGRFAPRNVGSAAETAGRAAEPFGCGSSSMHSAARTLSRSTSRRAT